MPTLDLLQLPSNPRPGLADGHNLEALLIRRLQHPATRHFKSSQVTSAAPGYSSPTSRCGSTLQVASVVVSVAIPVHVYPNHYLGTRLDRNLISARHGGFHEVRYQIRSVHFSGGLG
ncbi:hypothetical protein HBI56_211270 [Parastagonospora nodorum]|nr:hypothetical protein HBH53_197320 [Parastagonospora nodorum]KAH3961062.1 hypothetical protein HBH51_187140 [Parastagonospora nodorum]KAH3992681.1 hypothetical protein HBI10_212780 [Parastagonospora nodorum]KAH4018281.1 hypothetical protein HBI09_192350 [Parastagonospora nodorum]KAH4029756.1 hypothetical protein HBI13_032090 [Parastagonospora nodorum]